jgi:Phosphotransferase enzyme family
MLSFEDAAPYLLERGLIDPGWIIDGSLTIRSAASRNGNLKIEGPRGAGLLIKQPVDPAERGRETLTSEAKFYQCCQEEPAAGAMAEILPHLVYHDDERCLIALRLIPEAVTLTSYFRWVEEQPFAVALADALGRALASVHRTFRTGTLAQSPGLAWLSREAPWVMAIHRPIPEVLSSLGWANHQLICMLQTQEGLAEHLDSLRAQWLVETLIHGDIRSGNVLLGAGRGDSPWEIRIVDWEMVQLGDPAWDLAGALQDFARFWVDSMPMTPDLSIDERAAVAQFPTDLVQGLSRSLWHAYQGASELAPPESDALLDRAVKLSAVRMIQAAYEISDELMDLDPRSVIMLQLGANVLSYPEVARTQLFGIPRPAVLQ